MKFFRKILLIVFALVFMQNACAADTIDDLIAEKEKLCMELWNIKGWDGAILPMGVYEIGKDIPDGKWTIVAYENASVQVQYGASLRRGGASMHEEIDVIQSEKVTSPAVVWFDSSIDDAYFDLYLQNGMFLSINYGTAIMISGEEKKHDYTIETQKSMEELREKIHQIENEILGICEIVTLKPGTWRIGKDIFPGKYEIRPENGKKTEIKYGYGTEDKIEPFDYYVQRKLTSEEHEEYDAAEMDSVEYWELLEGDLIEVKKGNAILIPYKGKEPLELIGDQQLQHEWHELTDEERLERAIKRLVDTIRK